LIKINDVYVLQTTYSYLAAVSKSACSIISNQIAFYFVRSFLVGRDGVLVESMPFDRRVAGTNLALATT